MYNSVATKLGYEAIEGSVSAIMVSGHSDVCERACVCMFVCEFLQRYCAGVYVPIHRRHSRTLYLCSHADTICVRAYVCPHADNARTQTQAYRMQARPTCLGTRPRRAEFKDRSSKPMTCRTTK